MLFRKTLQCSYIVLKYNHRRCFSNTIKNRNTIFALSSGQGKCGVAVIRVSGPETGAVLKKLTGIDQLPKPRYALLKEIINPNSKEILDKGIILWFPGPRSFTGEDSCEFQVHGGIAVIESIMNALRSVNGLRPAEPGEFTKRAFMNGKLNLTEVEGLADLIAAETELQRKQAFLQSEGFLSKIYHSWCSALLVNLAHIEAHIDFAETEDLQEDTLQNVFINVSKLREEIAQHLADGCKGERLRNGVKTVIVGEANVGKSSLFNILCQKPAAIVTPIEGTTRDVLEVNIDISGYPLVLADTAGLRTQTTDVIELEGIQRALQHYKTADLVLLLVDGKKILNSSSEVLSDSLINSRKHFVGFDNNNKNILVILNKTDLIPENVIKQLLVKDNFIPISCKTQQGFPLLMEKLTEKLKTLCANPNQEHPSMNQVRHRTHLTDCLNSLENFEERKLKAGAENVVLLAEDLRQAVYHLGKLTGQITNEQILDIIFRDFCIGK